MASDGTQANRETTFGVISDSGAVVAFMSGASNPHQLDANGTYDVFPGDLKVGHTLALSISGDGATGNGFQDVFLRDLGSVLVDGFESGDTSAWSITVP